PPQCWIMGRCCCLCCPWSAAALTSSATSVNSLCSARPSPSRDRPDSPAPSCCSPERCTTM
ncbi:hypothetical protein M9458_005205, partial [Cirrhinus mrigala]